MFSNPAAGCVLRKGRQHCLVLKPAVQRIDEAEDLAEVVREYETQLAANRWGQGQGLGGHHVHSLLHGDRHTPRFSAAKWRRLKYRPC